MPNHKNLISKPLKTVEEVKTFITETCFSNYKKNIIFPFGIRLKEHPNDVVGMIGGRIHGVKGIFEISFHLSKDYRGFGYMLLVPCYYPSKAVQ